MLHGQKGLLKYKKTPGNPLRMFLHDVPENRSTQVPFFAKAHITQPLLHLHVSPYEVVFQTQPGLPLNFLLGFLEIIFVNVTHNTFLICFLNFFINRLIYIRCFIAIC